MMEPLAENLDGIIIEFKVRNPAKEKDLEASVQNALCQIREKNMIRSWKPGEFRWKESVIMDLPLRERKS